MLKTQICVTRPQCVNIATCFRPCKGIIWLRSENLKRYNIENVRNETSFFLQTVPPVAVDHQHGLGTPYCPLVYLHTCAQVAKKKTRTIHTETTNLNENIYQNKSINMGKNKQREKNTRVQCYYKKRAREI